MQTWKRGALRGLATVVFLAIVAAGKALPGQSSDDAARPAVPAVNDPWPEVNLNVVVLDKKGAPEKVDKGEFELLEDGFQRPFDLRNSADSAVSIAILIDTSGSMFDRLREIKTFVTELTRALPERSEVMIARFAGASLTVTSFTPASTIDLSFFDGLQYWGPSNVRDSIIVAERYFATHARYARRALVLISDGDDNASSSRLEDVMRSLQWPGAPTFYSLIVHNRYADYAEIKRGRVELEHLTNGGGGISIAPKEKDFAPAATHLADMIRSQYVLRFTATDPARDGKPHKLEVRLPAKDLKIHTLPVYYAPTK